MFECVSLYTDLRRPLQERIEQRGEPVAVVSTPWRKVLGFLEGRKS